MNTHQNRHFHMRWLPTLMLMLTLIIGAQSDVQASVGISNARAVGLGGAYVSVAEGAEAPSWNPANLGLYSRQGFSMNIISTGIGIHNNSFSKKQYDQYNGQYLDESDKEKLMNCIPDDGMTLNVNSEVQLLGFAYRYFAVTAAGVVESDLTISKDFFELGFYGNANKPTFDFGDTDGAAWASYDVTFSAGYPIEIQGVRQFSVGANLKYIQGLYCVDVVEAGGAFTTETLAVGEGQTTVQYAEGGKGFALDLGAASHYQSALESGIRAQKCGAFNYLG